MMTVIGGPSIVETHAIARVAELTGAMVVDAQLSEHVAHAIQV